MLVVVGGDGSVHAAAGHARAADVPIYQFPTGTENLFAREFGMDRRYRTLAEALKRGEYRAIDMGRCNGRTFLIMCSVGFDANVVHRLARVRKGAISHLSYAQHIAHELLFPSFEPLTIEIDGRVVVSDRPGFVVVANSRQYAMRLDPARRADMSDGLLDVVFVPFRTRVTLAAWTAGMRLGIHLGGRETVYERGTSVKINAAPGRRPGPAGFGERPGAALYQLDGEAPGVSYDREGDLALTPIEIGVEPRALRVLVP